MHNRRIAAAAAFLAFSLPRWCDAVVFPVPKLNLQPNHSKAAAAEEAHSAAKCPSMFVAVISQPQNVELRNSIRDMWSSASTVWGKLLAKYTVCTKTGVTEELQREQDEHNDMLFMNDCEEGYLNGLLTRKVATAMKTYIQDYSADHELFMKIDDDAFISPRRLCELLQWRKDQGMDNFNAYMGVFAEGPHEALQGPSSKHFPIRDPESPWYEPESKFSEAEYPPSAKGGTGYILSAQIVEPIIKNGIASSYELNNEDKAVGVWVDKLVKGGRNIEIVNIHGTDGYPEHADSIVTTGTYGAYPHIIHHHLSGSAIACLHDIDKRNDGWAEPIDGCFQSRFMQWSSGAKHRVWRVVADLLPGVA